METTYERMMRERLGNLYGGDRTATPSGKETAARTATTTGTDRHGRPTDAKGDRRDGR